MVVPDFTAKSAELRGDLYRACLAQADPGNKDNNFFLSIENFWLWDIPNQTLSHYNTHLTENSKQ